VDYGADAKHPSWKPRQILNDKMSQEDFYEFLVDVAKALAAACEPGAPVYLFMSAQEWGSIMSAMQRAGFHWSSTIVWVKDRFVLSRKDYNTQYEPIYYGWLDGTRRLAEIRGHSESDVWQFDRPRRSDEHPMMKPVALAENALRNSSRYGDIVLDAFAGSGTTLIACEQTDRICHTMELDPKYCDVIAKRFCLQRGSENDVFLLRGKKKLTYADARARCDFIEIGSEDGDLPFV
jgi:DNA modification methylase